MRAIALSLWIAGVLATTSFEASAKVREDFEKTVSFDPGGSFSIQNTNGSITIRTWNESSVKIEAEKVAKSEAHLKDIEIDVQGSGDSVRVETLYHRKHHHGSVSYTVLLPSRAQVEVRTANGAITVEGIEGHVTARSTNGSLKIEDVTGAVEASTTNGSIRARYEHAGDGRHRFATTNGSVRIYLPSDAGGAFEAETANGSIDVDFPLELTRTSRHHMKGRFGNGGGSFEIETVNGSVRILPH